MIILSEPFLLKSTPKSTVTIGEHRALEAFYRPPPPHSGFIEDIDKEMGS